jgi:bla regulator protein BlaR1
LPLLASMLVYTACETNQIKERPVVAKKELQTLYMEFQDGVKVSVGKKETFTDLYHGTNGVPEGVIVTSESLSLGEKNEYENSKSILKKNEKYGEIISLKLYRKTNGRVTIATIVDFSKMKSIIEKKDTEDYTVPFAIIEEVPVFPSCTGTREQKAACLNENIKKFVVRNFNVDLSKNLGLSKGKKKIWVIFKIDEKGNVTNVNARAPHPKLKEEAMRVVRLLPKMEPGKHLGKAVGMKYTLPISFNVD